MPKGRFYAKIGSRNPGLGRLWVESLRIDHASLLAGVRVNVWTSLVAILVGGAVALSGRDRMGAR